MTQMKFSEYNRTVKKGKLEELQKVCEEIFSNLKILIKNKKDLHNLILDDTRILKSDDISLSQKPEDFTKERIIQPILKVLEYEKLDIGRESKQQLDESKRWADYTLTIENDSVLVEAEPLNKDLRVKKSGVDQVREWILSKKTPTDFGIATDGFLWIMIKFDRNALKMRELKTINLRPIFLELIGQETFANKEEILKEFYTSFSKENIIPAFKEIFYELEEYREEISKKFYTGYMDFVFGINSKTGSLSREYSLLTAIKPPTDYKEEDLRLFAVTFMNRILFIKFLEDKGLVKKNLLRDSWSKYLEMREDIPSSFYKTYLQPLFFGVFNTPPDKRTSSVVKIEHFRNIPYLNGGLFRECVEKEPEYDIEDDILEKIIKDFLKEYDFTISGEKGVDPDILGNIFEKTINYISKPGTNRQKALGAYYTPDDVTTYIAKNTIHPFLIKKIREKFLANGWKESDLRKYQDLESFLNNLPRISSDVRSVLEIVRNITILDPACGSGHFLTAALKELIYIKESLLKSLEEDYSLYHLKRETIGKNLFGVDIEGPAVEIAKLRLWLSLIEDMEITDEEHIETLPNIEYNILQGDSLVGWVDELIDQKAVFKPYDDEQVKIVLEALEFAYAENKEKLDIISEAKENFKKYDIDNILKSYASLRSIYSLEYFEKAIKLGILLERIRKSIYRFFGENYARCLNDTLYPKKKKARDIVINPETIKKAFHWGVDFPSIIKKGGFNIILGNPPYIEKSKLLESTKKILKLYKTESCGNTHAFFFERSLTLLKKNGYCSLIVPISAVSTDRMSELQEILIENSETLRMSNYDDRPGKIFKDLEDCRSSIIISEKKISDSLHCCVYTTTYNRWYTKDRENLFNNLNYVDSTDFITEGSIPKVGEEIEKSILKKIFTNKPLKEYLSGESDEGQIWYHNAPRYWIRAMGFIPYFWNERDGEKASSQLVELNVTPSKYKEIAVATLNSSLFYWFFILYSDGRHLNLREVERFPLSLDKMGASIVKKLKIVSQELMEDYKENAKRKECTYAATGKVVYDEFYPGKSKHIIDKIDDFLANHYGFTDEEKDYIKTFSLTFRLGNKES